MSRPRVRLTWRRFFSLCLILLLFTGVVVGVRGYRNFLRQRDVLKAIIANLTAESRIAQVLVTEQRFDPILQSHRTTLKFLEYDTQGRPLPAKYFTFNGNLIQFQSLVVRFQDRWIKAGDALRGRSLYLFWKAFRLHGAETEEYVITPMDTVPGGYKIPGGRNEFEEEIWRSFWEYALNSPEAVKKGIKNAQVEAPGVRFLPGYLYTLTLEHDGGIRIDTEPIPDILRGETLEP